jgi:hypothetical protein
MACTDVQANDDEHSRHAVVDDPLGVALAHEGAKAHAHHLQEALERPLRKPEQLRQWFPCTRR